MDVIEGAGYWVCQVLLERECLRLALQRIQERTYRLKHHRRFNEKAVADFCFGAKCFKDLDVHYGLKEMDFQCDATPVPFSALYNVFIRTGDGPHMDCGTGRLAPHESNQSSLQKAVATVSFPIGSSILSGF